MMVAKGPNIILDLPFVQCPDLEQLLQLCSNGKLAILTPELKGQDMLSSVSFAMNDHRRLYVSFLHPDRARERKIDDGLKKSCSQQCYIGGKLVCTDYDGFMICHVDRGVYVATDRKDVLEKFIARWQQPWIGSVAFSELSVPLQYVAQDARFWGIYEKSDRWMAYSFSKDDTKPRAAIKVYETDEPGYVWNCRMSENFRNFSLVCINRRKAPCDLEAELLAGFPVEVDNGWSKKHFAIERINPWVLKLKTEDSRNIHAGMFFLMKYFLQQPALI